MDYFYKKIELLLWVCIVCMTVGISFVTGTAIEVHAAANGTADGTYDFGGIVGANNSAGQGFATFSDKFLVSNGFQVDGTKLKATGQFPFNEGKLVIKAEGTTTNKVFDLRSLGLSTDEIGGATLEYIHIEYSYANKVREYGIKYFNIVLSNNTIQLDRFFRENISNISEIVITWKLKDYLDASKLNFENITIANVNPHVPPIISSSSSSNISYTGATVYSSVLSEGDAPVTERGFVFAEGRIPTLNDKKVIVYGTTGSFEATLSDLSPNTVYYYSAYAMSSVGTVFDNKTFKYFITLMGFRVVYNGNGETAGVVPSEYLTYAPGNSVSVRGNTGNLEKAGYTFNGWNTEADGSGTSYTENAPLTMASSNVILYAQWAVIPPILTYTVTYDGNGTTSGSVPIDSTMYTTGDTVRVEGNPGNLEKSGNTFNGWNTEADGSGTSYTENAPLTMGSSNVMLYAQWAVIPPILTYTVTYDGNGTTSGSVPIDSTMYTTGDTVRVVGNPGNLENSGYTFNGWNTEADGSGTSYTENAPLTMASSNVILYAQWAVIPPILTYTVTYDGNGTTSGSVPIDSTMYTTGDTVRVEGNPGNLEKSGNTFNGWNTEADGSGTSYTENDSIKFGSSNMTLFAMWSANSYRLSFETNGGNAIANQTILFEQLATAPSVPTKAGYTFAGWYKDTALTKAWDFTKDFLTEHTTLYAKWIANSTVGDGGNTPTPIEPVPTPEEPKQPEKPEETKPKIIFNDISTNWAKDMIEDIAARGIILGYPDGTFRPNDPIKREHVAVMLARAFELTSKREATSFSDVPSSHPYYEAIMQLQKSGIIDGSNGAFNPTELLTRAQLAKILVLALGITPGGASTFKDVPTTHWSYDYIAALADVGIALGDNGNFRPEEPITRAQFVAFMYRVLTL